MQFWHTNNKVTQKKIRTYPTPLILTAVYHIHAKVNFCDEIAPHKETETCGIDTHFYEIR